MVLELALHMALEPVLHMALEQEWHSHNRHRAERCDLATDPSGQVDHRHKMELHRNHMMEQQ